VNDLRLGEETKPVPREGESLIQVTAVGICGSDLHWVSEGTTGDGGITAPFVLGHEFAGVVEGGALHGTRAAIDPHVPCGTCEFCLEGNPNLCPDHYFAGQAPQDGALQEYLAWPSKMVIPVPDSISNEEAAMLEPLGVAIHTTNLGKLKPGMTVGVYGCGPIGLLVIQLARLAGASKIIATDRLTHRLEAAKEFGAAETILADESKESQEILSLSNERGLDVTFEVAGENHAVDTAVETCKPGGRVVLCGISSVNETSFKASTARRKGLTLKVVRRMKHTYPQAIDLVASGKVDVGSLVSHRFPLEKFKEAFHISRSREGLKVIINL
jgi:L-iditol 2-dehydrogenase